MIGSVKGSQATIELSAGRGVAIRAYHDDDLEAAVSCFGQSVREIGARYYSSEQVAAWAPDPPDMEGWAKRLRTGGVFVADPAAVAGFARRG
jgi:putative acetyltransferase